MATRITWLGHATWLVETGAHKLLIDPFLDDNPSAAVKAAGVSADFVLVSHGHFDHMADAASIAQRCQATLISNYEICEWFSKRGVEKTLGMNLGGAAQLSFGKVKLTIAHHSSTLPDGSPAGNPSGFLLTLPGAKIYFACDTALFLDMQLVGAGGLDLAVLPIGDLFTMGPEDSIEAVKLLRPKRVAPSHYGTWPPIAQDPAAWAALVREQTAAEPLTPKAGEKFVI